jgi:hypothetical protein
VKVEVGGGVSVRVELGVVVGNKIGVTVAAGVGEGDGGSVEVGIVVGVGKTISVDPSQAMRKKAVPNKSNKNFLVIASWRRFDCVALSARHAITTDDSNPRESAGLRA